MPSTVDFIPPASEAIELPVDELALRLLRYFGACDAIGEKSPLNLHSILLDGMWKDHGIDPSDRTAFFGAISEAVTWLTSHVLLAQRPDQGEGWLFITRAGMRVLEADSLSMVRAESRLGVDLHPRLGHRIHRQFILGEYELAAFAAMKEVEVVVQARAVAAKIALEAAVSAEESSKRMEVASERLGTLTLALVISTSVLAFATVVLVIVTATQ